LSTKRDFDDAIGKEERGEFLFIELEKGGGKAQPSYYAGQHMIYIPATVNEEKEEGKVTRPRIP